MPRAAFRSVAKESKLERFERLAQKRMTAALRHMRLIGNLANRHNYDFTDDHVHQMFETLEGEIKELKRRFGQDGAVKGHDFQFRK
jgi:hypothetical protein